MLSPQEVNKSLDDIRPYIEADGGYLEFVEIDYNLDENIRTKLNKVSFFILMMSFLFTKES